MPGLRFILRVLTHGQILMALSAVSYVLLAELYLNQALVMNSWVLAAFFGTLGLYLLDSIRSADREDMISQPVRASLFRNYRATALLGGLVSLILGLAGIVLARPGLGAWCVLLMLAFLAIAYLCPLVPWRGGLITLKSLSRAKPLTISLAWVIGALLVAGAGALPQYEGARGWPAIVFILTTLPLLLLDSIWLDRRDQMADVAFGNPTISSQLTARRFQQLCAVLWFLPLVVLPFAPEYWVAVLGLQAGSLVLVLIEPDRLSSEAVRVMVACGWRFSGLVCSLIWLG